MNDFDKALRSFHREFYADYNTRLDTAAEKFAKLGNRETQIRDIKAQYDVLAKEQGGSLTAQQIEAKHKAYAVELNHVVEGMDKLLTKNQKIVQSAYDTASSKTQARKMLEGTYSHQNALRQDAEVKTQLNVILRDASDGTADLTLGAKTEIAAKNVEWVQEILDNTDNVPYDLPKPSLQQTPQNGARDKKEPPTDPAILRSDNGEANPSFNRGNLLTGAKVGLGLAVLAASTVDSSQNTNAKGVSHANTPLPTQQTGVWTRLSQEVALTLSVSGMEKVYEWAMGKLSAHQKDNVPSDVRRQFPKGEFNPKAENLAVANLNKNKVGYLEGDQYWERNGPSNNCTAPRF